MDLWPWAVALFGAATLGSLAGFLLGLIPGVHPNNLASGLLLAKPAFLAFLAFVLTGSPAADFATLALTGFLVAAVVAHGIAAFVPSVFLGAPGEGSALSVLPGHRLLWAGRGHEAVAVAARGAVLGALASSALLIPLRWVMGPPVDGYVHAQAAIPFILAALVVLLILSEGRRRRGRSVSSASGQRARAAVLFLGSGALGWVVLGTDWPSRWNWFPFPGLHGDAGSLTLLPLFTGLFGLSTVLLSARSGADVPPQVDGAPTACHLRRAVLSGSLAGAVVSWLPGLSSGAATSLAQFLARRRANDEEPAEFMASLGAVGAAVNIFTVAALFIIHRARSGVAVAIRDVVGSSGLQWEDPAAMPGLVAAVVLAALLAAALAYPLAVRASRIYASLVSRLPYRAIAVGVAVFLVSLVAVLAGASGLVIAGLAVPLGLLPPRWGVKRVHLMGALLVPVIAFAV